MAELSRAPHLAFPVAMVPDGSRLMTREELTVDDIEDCVEVLLSTMLGEREESPTYGIPEQAFRQGGADLQLLQATIERWEPRAASIIAEADFTDLVQRVSVRIGRRDVA